MTPDFLSVIVSPTIQNAVAAELISSVFKYPDGSIRHRRSGAVQEMGETLQAISKHEMKPSIETLEHLEKEATQAIATLYRLLAACSREKQCLQKL